MKVRQILNNNVALVERGGHESIVYSTGISFRKKVGQIIEENEIERMYVLDSRDRLEHFSYLLSNTDEKTIDLVNELVSDWEKETNRVANDYLYLALLDHIMFAVKRARKGQFILSPLTWEVKKFYPTYFNLGLEALEKMKMIYEIEFPEDEAVSLALHFINLQGDQLLIEEKLKDLEILRDILNIIKYQFKIVYDEKSLSYMRLVSHLQYFIERLRRNIPYVENDSILYEQVKKLYPDSFEAVSKISIYVKEKFDVFLSKEEYTYLMIHINRVTERTDES